MIAVLSLVISLCALAIFVECFLFRFRSSILAEDLGPDLTLKVQTMRQQTFDWLVTISCVSFLLGLVGTQCNRQSCNKYTVLSIMFGVTLFFLWTSTLAFGVAIVSVSYSGP